MKKMKMKKRQTESGVMESFLDKRGHNVKTWKKRYFVLNENRKVISYFVTSEKKIKRGSLKIHKVFDLPDRLDQKNKRTNRMDFHGVHSGTKMEISICVSAETLDLKQQWISALHESIEIKGIGSRGSVLNGSGAGSPSADNGMMPISEADFGSIDFESLAIEANSSDSNNIKVDLDDAGDQTKKSKRQRSSIKAAKLMGSTVDELDDDKPTKEGYLAIKTAFAKVVGLSTAWEDFYFVFDGISRMLAWYKSEDQRKMYGYMEVLVMFDVPNRNGKKKNRLEFYGVMKDSACGYLSVSAAAPEEKQGWINMLQNTVQTKDSNDFHNLGLEAVPVGENHKQMDLIAHKYAHTNVDLDSEFRMRMQAAAGMVVTPLASIAVMAGMFVAPTRTKNYALVKSIQLLNLTQRLDIHFTKNQEERIHIAIKLGIMRNEVKQAAVLLWGVFQEVLHDPANTEKIHHLIEKGVNMGVDMVETRIGPPFAWKENQRHHLHAAAKNLFHGRVAQAKLEARKAAMALLKDEEKLNAILERVKAYAVKEMALDPAVVDILLSSKKELIQNISETGEVSNVERFMQTIFKVNKDLLSYLEKSVFLPGVIRTCGGEKNMPLWVEEKSNQMGRFLWDEIQYESMAKLALMLQQKEPRTGRGAAGQKVSQIVRVPPSQSAKGWKKRCGCCRRAARAVARRACCGCGCLRRFRCWFLYHWMPYDVNLWTKARDPVWLFFNLIICNPFSTPRTILYSVHLMCIERRDEYQLVNFIRSFKSWHFLATGVMGMCIGVLQYMRCVIFQDGLVVDQEDARKGLVHTCNEVGPGAHFIYFYEVGAFFLNVFVMWFAFYLLRFSYQMQNEDSGQGVKTNLARVNSGMTRVGSSSSDISSADGESGGEGGEDREENLSNLSTGSETNTALAKIIEEEQIFKAKRSWSFLRWMLIWDTFCFFFGCSCVVLAIFYLSGWQVPTLGDDGDGGLELWKLRSLLTWLRVFYGLCAWPFAVFTLPFESAFFFKLMTHAVPTGYDKHGNLRIKRIRANDIGIQMAARTLVAPFVAVGKSAMANSPRGSSNRSNLFPLEREKIGGKKRLLAEDGNDGDLRKCFVVSRSRARLLDADAEDEARRQAKVMRRAGYAQRKEQAPLSEWWRALLCGGCGLWGKGKKGAENGKGAAEDGSGGGSSRGRQRAAARKRKARQQQQQQAAAADAFNEDHEFQALDQDTMLDWVDAIAHNIDVVRGRGDQYVEKRGYLHLLDRRLEGKVSRRRPEDDEEEEGKKNSMGARLRSKTSAMLNGRRETRGMSTARPAAIDTRGERGRQNTTFRLRWVELDEDTIRVFPTRADALAAKKREAAKSGRKRASCVSYDTAEADGEGGGAGDIGMDFSHVSQIFDENFYGFSRGVGTRKDREMFGDLFMSDLSPQPRDKVTHVPKPFKHGHFDGFDGSVGDLGGGGDGEFDFSASIGASQLHSPSGSTVTLTHSRLADSNIVVNPITQHESKSPGTFSIGAVI